MIARRSIGSWLLALSASICPLSAAQAPMGKESKEYVLKKVRSVPLLKREHWKWAKYDSRKTPPKNEHGSFFKCCKEDSQAIQLPEEVRNKIHAMCIDLSFPLFERKTIPTPSGPYTLIVQAIEGPGVESRGVMKPADLHILIMAAYQNRVGKGAKDSASEVAITPYARASNYQKLLPKGKVDELQKSGKRSFPARRAGKDNTFTTGPVLENQDLRDTYLFFPFYFSLDVSSIIPNNLKVSRKYHGGISYLVPSSEAEEVPYCWSQPYIVKAFIQKDRRLPSPKAKGV